MTNDEAERRASDDAAPAQRPLLSVGLLNYNYSRYLAACIESILAQSFQDFELVVIDDCSKDDSVSIISRYLGDPRVRLVAHAKNRGFVESLIEVTEEHSRGKYLTVISADDYVLDRDAFAKQIALLESDQETALCFAAYERIEVETERSIEITRSFPADRIFTGREFLEIYLRTIDIQILHSGTIVRASAYRACGGYRRDMSFCVDSALWFSLPLYGKVAYSASVLYCYRIHRNQMSASVPSIVPTVREMTAAIEGLFQTARRKGFDVGVSRAEAIRTYLPAMAVAEAFAGRSRESLLRLAAVVRFGGWDGFSSKKTWIAALRVAAGGTVFEGVRKLARSVAR